MTAIPDARRAIPAEDRIADALADLADTFTALREWMERAQAKDDQEEAERAARDKAREPAEWQAALDTLAEFLTGHFDSHRTMGEPKPGVEQATELVAAIDSNLRGGYSGLRYAFERLSVDEPPGKLDRQASNAAIDAHPHDPEAQERYRLAWLDGATWGMR